MQIIYYEKESGFICDRLPNPRPHTEDCLSMELSDEDFEMTCTCDWGKAWAVVDGKIQQIDDLEFQNTDQYKKIALLDEKRYLEYQLSQTDWIISKLNELKIEDEEAYEVAKEKYSDVLTERKAARTRINELEELLTEFDEK